MGARLAKLTRAPELVIGCRPDRASQEDLTEAKLMAMFLEFELCVQTKWIENQLDTTLKNAQFSSKILLENQIDPIYLITAHWHMLKAKKFLRKSCFK
jgi:uncharacterized SAM-binding protein YcdF (DUF218 family)